MEKALILSLLTYAAGYWLAHAMLRTEHAAEGHTYTKGQRLATYLLSLCSWLMVGYILTSTWYSKIKALGYWDKPVQEPKKEGAK